MANESPISRLYSYFPIAEGIAIAAFATGLLLRYLSNPTGSQVILISLGALAGIYYLNAFQPRQQPSDEERVQPMGFGPLLGRTIIPKVLGIGLSVSVIGILFTVQRWNGFREMLLIGATSLAAASLIGLVATQSDEQARKDLGPLLLRAVPLALIGFYLLWVYGLKSPAVNPH